MRLSGVSDNLAIPMPEDSGTASSLVARPNSPRLREGRAFGVKIFQFAEIHRHGLYRLTGYVFSVASNPEGCQKLAGGRSATETTGVLRKKTQHPGRGARNGAAGRLCDPSRVALVSGRIPGVAAFGLTPG